MSIRWLRNVVIDGKKSTLEVQLGDRRIGDKCYTRINEEVESWFDNYGGSEDRAQIIAQGVNILRARLNGRNVTYPNGQQYDWQ
ncbi:MAG: hypothetical protein LBC59_05265 [Chitinispirillales bacterium]|jgi:hypothetical protein|nr:hypothetical protein [Chitinispirillales bacterium]